MIAMAALMIHGGIEKKGLQVQMVEDAVDLGIRQAAVNVQLGDLLVPAPNPSGVELKDPSFAALASTVVPLQRAGVKVYLILLDRATGNEPLDSALMHPKYDRHAPNRLSAFNVVGSRGIGILRSTCSAIERRFGNAIAGWIVGNEVDSHWEWANQGEASLGDIADTTERSLRIVHDATRKPVYLSLDHCWSARSSSSTHSIPGKDLLERVALLARRRGDFEWRIAYHPYPENLFDPRFWRDPHAVLSFDAPVISFRNLEVLTEFLKRRDLLWHGRPRAVNLSEEGFHREDGVAGEDLQAAAYAYAFRRVAANPGIEAFILNRHVDNSGEGGLRLGLWTNRPGSVGDPDRRTRMWAVFRACGTPTETSESAFALKLIGLDSWRGADPLPMRRWPKVGKSPDRPSTERPD